MRDLSLKGVARRYRGITSGFSVAEDIFDGPFSGSVSLRSRLQSLARAEHSFDVSECVYGWTAAFEQTWTHIRIRIELDPDAGITNATMNTLRTNWQNGIESTWSDRWGCGREGELTCPLTFEVQWVAADAHHTVRVRQGPAQTNMTTWDTSDSGNVAAHEFGHMLGHPDEYSSATCPDRDPVDTGTVMDNNSANVPARLMTRFADNLGSAVVGI
jgi:Immune inhibitor A peptidase M6, catalytic domain